MKYYLIAGEASGDLHGASLMGAIRAIDSNAEFRFWGGNKMLEISDNIVHHYRDTSYMGFVEVAKNLKKILSFLSHCKKDITSFQPDVLILIDYPGFNLRISQWAKREGFKIAYYIAPQVWAWKPSRINQMKRDIDKLFVILPFEKAYFEERGMKAEYFGHPLINQILQFKSTNSPLNNIPENCIACLPGSRSQEIKKHLTYIVELAKNHPQEKFVIAAVDTVDQDIYRKLLSQQSNIQYVHNMTYSIFSKAKLGIIASGTATLEACLFNVPQIVIYKGNALSYQIAKRLVSIKYISLVNLIADQEIIPELIQSELNNKNLEKHFSQLLESENQKKQKRRYQAVTDMLKSSDVSTQIAQHIMRLANN